MKTGMTIEKFASEIERRDDAQRDFVLGTPDILYYPATEPETEDGAHGPEFLSLEGQPFGINEVCHRQLATHHNVPWAYYRRMLEECPSLLGENINHWLAQLKVDSKGKESIDRRMVRTLDGVARAYLSNKYLRFDHKPFSEIVLPVLAEHNAKVKSCDLTDSHLFLKFTFPSLRVELNPGQGDWYEPGGQISNSETGQGKSKGKVWFFREICKNGMGIYNHVAEYGRVHLGSAIDELGEIESAETQRYIVQATASQIRDSINAMVNPETIERIIESMRATTEVNIPGEQKIPEAMEQLGKALKLTEDERGSMLRHLIEGGDLSQYGIIQAVTRTAEDLPSYDRATEVESIGGKLLATSPSKFRQLCTVLK